MNSLIDSLLIPVAFPFLQSQRVYWLYLLGAVGIAACVYLFHKIPKEQQQPKSLWDYLFPRKIYSHPSAIVDYKFFYANTILETLLIFPLFRYSHGFTDDTIVDRFHARRRCRPSGSKHRFHPCSRSRNSALLCELFAESERSGCHWRACC